MTYTLVEEVPAPLVLSETSIALLVDVVSIKVWLDENDELELMTSGAEVVEDTNKEEDKKSVLVSDADVSIEADESWLEEARTEPGVELLPRNDVEIEELMDEVKTE